MPYVTTKVIILFTSLTFCTSIRFCSRTGTLYILLVVWKLLLDTLDHDSNIFTALF